MQVISGRFVGSQGAKELEKLVNEISGPYQIGEIEVLHFDGKPAMNSDYVAQYVKTAVEKKLGYAQHS